MALVIPRVILQLLTVVEMGKGIVHTGKGVIGVGLLNGVENE